MHAQTVTLTFSQGLNFHGIRDRKQRKLSETFPPHHSSLFACDGRFSFPPAIAHSQVFLVHVPNSHSDSVVLDHDRVVVQVECYLDALRIRIPSVCNDLGQYSRHIAVEVYTQVVEYVEIDRHPIRVVEGGH